MCRSSIVRRLLAPSIDSIINRSWTLWSDRFTLHLSTPDTVEGNHARIIDGFLKFRREAFPQRSALYEQLATNQRSRTLFIACSDSRLVPELVTQQEPGEMFVIRNAATSRRRACATRIPRRSSTRRATTTARDKVEIDGARERDGAGATAT